MRTYNLKDQKTMRNLNPNDIDQLICFKGMVIRVSPITPDTKSGFFQCTVCKATYEN